MTQSRSGWVWCRLVLVGVTAIALLLPSASLAKKDKKKDKKKGKEEISFFATSLGRTSFEIMIVQYWSRGARFRSETVVSGHPIVTIVSDGMYYTYDALTQKGYAVPRTKAAIAEDAKRMRPFGNDLEELLADGGEKISSEVLNGVDVDVYRVTDGRGRRTLWASSGTLQVPVRLESYDRKSGRTGNLDWITWLPGLKIDETFFKPSSDLDLKRFKSYEAFMEALQEKPVEPVPPLFHYLLHSATAE